MFRVEFKKKPYSMKNPSHNVHIDRISDVSVQYVYPISLTASQKLALVCRKPYYSTTCICEATTHSISLFAQR